MTAIGWRTAVVLLVWFAAAQGQTPSGPLTIEQVIGRFLERNLAVEEFGFGHNRSITGPSAGLGRRHGIETP